METVGRVKTISHESKTPCQHIPTCCIAPSSQLHSGAAALPSSPSSSGPDHSRLDGCSVVSQTFPLQPWERRRQWEGRRRGRRWKGGDNKPSPILSTSVHTQTHTYHGSSLRSLEADKAKPPPLSGVVVQHDLSTNYLAKGSKGFHQ